MSESYEQKQLDRIRHSLAHVMAQAVMERFPEAHIAIGPPIEDGFYYDIEFPQSITDEDIEAIDEADEPAHQQDSDLRPPDGLAINEVFYVEPGHAHFRRECRAPSRPI